MKEMHSEKAVYPVYQNLGIFQIDFQVLHSNEQLMFSSCLTMPVKLCKATIVLHCCMM